MSRTRANLLLLAIALIWGSAFIAQNKGMASIGPLLFTGVRFIVGALVVAPLAWLELRRRPARRILPREALAIGGLGMLMFAGAAMQQIGIVHTSVTHAGFLTALYVPLVPLLSWMVLRHLPHWSVWPGALACVVGAWLLSGASAQAGFGLSDGDLWVALSALPWAVHVLFVGNVADRMHAPFTVAMGQFLVCGVTALLAAACFEPVSASGLADAAGPLAYGGVLSVGVAFTAQVVAQRHAHPSDAAIILSAETVFAAIFGYVLLGDRLTPEGIFGCGLILASMVAIQLLPLLRRTPTTA
ncbi:MAG: DMT family transporter [Paucibacter sp.]|nr:DMT family transporter [Roseateles sp.]